MKLELLKKICFHDSEIRAYKKNGNDITFLIADGWIPNTYFKITLKNIKVEVMKDKPAIIRTTLYHFNDIFINAVNYHIDDSEVGTYEDGNRYYLKIYIDYPSYEVKTTKEERKNYKFDEFNVSLCDDYNPKENTYIKFIMDDFEVEEF